MRVTFPARRRLYSTICMVRVHLSVLRNSKPQPMNSKTDIVMKTAQIRQECRRCCVCSPRAIFIKQSRIIRKHIFTGEYIKTQNTARLYTAISPPCWEIMQVRREEPPGTCSGRLSCIGVVFHWKWSGLYLQSFLLISTAMRIPDSQVVSWRFLTNCAE
ncbi:Hypothetical_protein [Hexamita inflata]|uniref:Hypothetical_protein n=1 Tax=Hexamita inflata TaxID=28002 RepID=A0AA86UNS4_9EUKA|nr:Hypothetical protein HINF_LOCUS33588 [Hexamita inflata]